MWGIIFLTIAKVLGVLFLLKTKQCLDESVYFWSQFQLQPNLCIPVCWLLTLKTLQQQTKLD